MTKCQTKINKLGENMMVKSEGLTHPNEELAKRLSIRTISEFCPKKLPIHLKKKISYSFASKRELVCLEEKDSCCVVVLFDPLNIDSIEELRLILNKEIEIVWAPLELILLAQESFYNQLEGATSDFLISMGEGSKKKELSSLAVDLLEAEEDAPMIHLLNLILSEAIQQKASDIHFEPFEEDLIIRYRIDGVLQKRHAPRSELQSKLLTRIKVLAHLDIAEHRLPQDGRIKIKMGQREIDLRVSTLPTSHGERIVLRILDKGNLCLNCDQLGFPSSMLEEYQKLIASSEGIILVTGPTGSGKTTTLYSTLMELASDACNIMTIEDPIEYKLPGISQIAVHPKIGLTFSRGLRHILRQDPDIVMIGEIRDRETAEIAIQASMTGHLVFSTLHTNDAPTAIARLIDMGVEPFLLSATIKGVVAQRLVRMICSHCKESYLPTTSEEQKWANLISSKVLYRGKGCAHCFGQGYLGRGGLWELMIITDYLRSKIAEKMVASELRKLAIKEGMMSLHSHGLCLIKQGKTTFPELLRVVNREDN